jgi:protein-tyrosine kinase
MSRIHDALKKAQQERGLDAATDLVLPQIDPPAGVPTWKGAGPGLPASESKGEATQHLPLGASSTEYLRFDDLVARCAHPRWHPDPNVNVFSNHSLSSPGTEQFRTLRSRLYQLREGQSLRTILITSAIPAEGKTFVASNLAQSIIRQSDRRVLLIDADLRCARLHVPLGAPRSPGLTEYLRGDADELSVIQRGEEGNLCLIAGGSEVADPSELLSNGLLKALLDRVTPVFDWVILDSPPSLPVADASMLADLCDGVLLVVRAGSTPSELSQKATQELKGRNVLGVVLNGIDDSDAYGAYYYANYGYGPAKVEVSAG